MIDIESIKKELMNEAQSGKLRQWAERKDRVDLYQTALGWPTVTTAMDGIGVPADWNPDSGKSKSETLFRAMKDISPSWNLFYGMDHDEAWGMVSMVDEEINPERLHPRALSIFETNPAEQGGHCYLGYFLKTLDDCVLFMYAPEIFRISLFGRMKVLIPDALGKKSG